jgi:uncharacterized protein (TIGR03000 family)
MVVPSTGAAPAPAATTPVPMSNYAPGTQEAIPVTTTFNSAPAKLFINVPADTRLFVDGQLTTSTTENRVFSTPALQTGLTYFYDLKAEITRDGLTHSESKRVIVRSGDSIRTSFAVLEAQLKNSVITTTASK